ncbi:MAG: acetoacetate decarboxylase family protein [Candidatus Microthrix parvicella]|jgi:acetoacetate decarboxylase|nr:acetoacetate decarboxylase family protein [Candidatus Microthrix sp.]MBK7321910.1 acetoacetate decarboxylase family protein [Candidatus Microthrix sp.]MBP7594778.1 acetoacetate decarboxylase family protein [Candidatus Microthrix sp.]
MSQLRYGPRPVADTTDGEVPNREVAATKIGAWSTSLTATFLTDPEVIAAVLPPPLEPPAEPMVKVSISRVDLGGGRAPFGAGTFAVAARHRDTEGYYPLLMPMTTEQAVIGGRETFGEPKKLADITLETVPEQSSGSAVRGLVTRMGVGIIELDGTLGDELDPPPSGERLDYYLKFLRDPGGAGFDDDPWLVYCTRETETRSHRAANVALTLRESRFDPVADIPILGPVTATLSERRSQQAGRLVERVPAADVLPYAHQRYDDVSPVDTRK